ncbi:MAG: sulfatase-like hydrolase/transferase [Planctomycetota bacterium]|nr:sulfatase-like hydrolase/transferase [Planctomycetota bacterium]
MSRSSTARRVALVAAGLGLLPGCGEPELPLTLVRDGQAEITGQGVLVVVVDGLRWDHTSLAGYDRDTTPFLLSLANEGMVFTDAWSPTASRLGAHVAILTGCDPDLARPPRAAETGEEEPTDSWFLPSSLDLIGQPFLGAGWTTAAFVDDPDIAELRSFDRGFREFTAYGGDPTDEDDDGQVGVIGVGGRFVQWLYAEPLDQNWFAYVHLDDLERVLADREEGSAYRANPERDEWVPRPELSRVLPIGITEPMLHALPPSRAAEGEPLTLGQYELRYDRGIRAIDKSLRRLVGYADDFGRTEDLTIVIVGSHGLALGEGGLYLQAGRAAEADLHVPLIVRPSEALKQELGWDDGKRSRRAGGIVSLADLAPTLVELLDLRPPEHLQGVSLVPMLRDPDAVVRDRVFLRASALGGRGIAEPDAVLSAAADGAVSVRARGAGAGHALGARRGESLLESWAKFQLLERRALHFGEVGRGADPRVELLRLQGASGEAR